MYLTELITLSASRGLIQSGIHFAFCRLNLNSTFVATESNKKVFTSRRLLEKACLCKIWKKWSEVNTFLSKNIFAWTFLAKTILPQFQNLLNSFEVNRIDLL